MGKHRCVAAHIVEKSADCAFAHWAVENSFHWTLGATFDEDRCRIRKKHSPANFDFICRAALNISKNTRAQTQSS